MTLFILFVKVFLSYALCQRFDKVKICRKKGQKMKENKFLSAIAGSIIGFIVGTVFYYWPTSCLITGPIVGDEILMPRELANALLRMSATYGGSIGVLIGIFSGLSVSITMPRGHMSKTISCTSFLVCTIVSFIQYGHFLTEMSIGRIVITFGWVFALFLFSIPLGGLLGFIEKIRE